MKTIIGKIAVWISDTILKRVILWAAGFEKRGKNYVRPGFIYPTIREIAVEAAEADLRRTPVRFHCFRFVSTLLAFLTGCYVLIFAAAYLLCYLTGLALVIFVSGLAFVIAKVLRG